MIPQAQTVLAGMALVIVGVLTFCLIFYPVPQGNQQLVTFALGALAGALVVGGSKAAEKIGTAINTQVQAEPQQGPEQ